jgi:hypothetical protein
MQSPGKKHRRRTAIRGYFSKLSGHFREAETVSGGTAARIALKKSWPGRLRLLSKQMP